MKPVGGRPEPAWTRTAAAIGAGVFLVAGVWAFADPESFFDDAAHFEPYNQHLLQDIGGLVGFTPPSGWQDDPFRTIEGDWRLHQGGILTDHLRLRAEGMEALLTGSVGLDQSIEYAGNLFLPAQLFSRRGALMLLRHEDAGHVTVPFRVTGVVGAPRIALDEKALVDPTKEELVDTVRKRLGGKLEELFGQPPAPGQPRQESEKTAPEPDDRAPGQRWPGKILQELFRR